MKLAALQAWFGMDADYAATRQRMLQWVADTDDPDPSGRVARIVCMRPISDCPALSLSSEDSIIQTPTCGFRNHEIATPMFSRRRPSHATPLNGITENTPTPRGGRRVAPAATLTPASNEAEVRMLRYRRHARPRKEPAMPETHSLFNRHTSVAIHRCADHFPTSPPRRTLV